MISPILPLLPEQLRCCSRKRLPLGCPLLASHHQPPPPKLVLGLPAALTPAFAGTPHTIIHVLLFVLLCFVFVLPFVLTGFVLLCFVFVLVLLFVLTVLTSISLVTKEQRSAIFCLIYEIFSGQSARLRPGSVIDYKTWKCDRLGESGLNPCSAMEAHSTILSHDLFQPNLLHRAFVGRKSRRE